MSDDGPVPRPYDGLTVSLFGAFDLRVKGRSLPPLRSRKTQWLFALLTLRAGRPFSRDALAAILWPESDGEKALYNLRRTLHDLRQALGASAYRLTAPDARTIRLDLSGAEVDVTAFDEALHRGDPASLSRAVSLYRGPLLEGCAEAWAVEDRAVRDEGCLNALERLAADAMRPTPSDPQAAVVLLRRALARAPTRETALRALLEALAAIGDRASLIQEYRAFRLRLHEELRAIPSPETQQLYERLKDAAVPDEPRTVISAFPDTALSIITPSHRTFEPAGGAVPLGSEFYVDRETDVRFFEALSRGDSVVLVKGPRQVGKTSLLVRGRQRAREAGARVAFVDIQKFSSSQFESSETFLLALARQVVERLEMEVTPEDGWNTATGANDNFERFLRRKVLAPSHAPLVLMLDEVDQLFPCRWAGEVFGLFRSWHNERALDPDGPWSLLTLAMAYATEARLFITDLNQSPFNVGTKITLEDFSGAEVAEVDRRLGAPLGSPERRARFTTLVGGHPYLVRRGLQELLTGTSLERLEGSAAREDGPFGDHLRRLLYVLSQDTHLCDAVRDFLTDGTTPDRSSFFRLHSAGVLAGDTPEEARPRCGVYADFLTRSLS